MKYYILLALAGLVLSCQNGSTSIEEDAETNSMETPRIDYTIWSENTELFVEFPVLIVGEQSRFAAHFTVLNKHQSVDEGTVTVSLVQGTKGVRQKVDAPSSPGIFSPVIEPVISGNSKLIFELKTNQYTDTLVLENVMVYGSIVEAIKDITDEAPVEKISFLKEQAWKMEFQTAKVKRQDVFESIPTTGIWRSPLGNNKGLIATSSGTVDYYKNNLTIGTRVNTGELLLTIKSDGLSTNNLNSEIKKSKINYEQASLEYERKKELYNDKVIAKAEYEIVEQKYLIAKENYNRLSNNFSNGGKKVKVPFNGFVKSIKYNNGDFVEEGDVLMTIADEEFRILEVQVSSQYAGKLDDIRNVYYKTDQEHWANILDNDNSILSVNRVISDEHPMMSVFVSIKENISFPEGGFSEVNLIVGNPSTGVVIPKSALLESYGKYSVIVQLSGESFESRNVTIGPKNGNLIEITSGLSENEMIVTKGAYQVKMVSMSGQAPAHGHAH